MKPSATIITLRRSQRSTNAPAKGPMKTVGSSETSIPDASTVADPVVSVSHQTSANWARLLPMSDSCCPVQIEKNEVCHLDWGGSIRLPVIQDPLLVRRARILLSITGAVHFLPVSYRCGEFPFCAADWGVVFCSPAFEHPLLSLRSAGSVKLHWPWTEEEIDDVPIPPRATPAGQP